MKGKAQQPFFAPRFHAVAQVEHEVMPLASVGVGDQHATGLLDHKQNPGGVGAGDGMDRFVESTHQWGQGDVGYFGRMAHRGGDHAQCDDT